MDINMVRDIGKEFMNILRFRTIQVGIKLLERVAEIPRDFQRVKKGSLRVQ